MRNQQVKKNVRLGLPKGRMWPEVARLLSDAGCPVHTTQREYRPSVPISGIEVKILKPQNIVEMLHRGSRDIGFAGCDWVVENGASLVELLDTGLDAVRLVVAAPSGWLWEEFRPPQEFVIATEYQNIGRQWIARKGLLATLVRSFGATEVFPPEDADAIIDITATGSTLEANNLEILEVIMSSTTRLYAHPRALEDPAQRTIIETFVVLLKSVIEARQRVMLEVNISKDKLQELVLLLPAMRRPTISALHGEGFAVKVAAPRAQLPQLIPLIKAMGGTDIVITNLNQVIP